MLWLPIVHRELQIAARRLPTYRHRLLVGGLAALVALGAAIFSDSSPSETGRSLFAFLSWAAFFLCVLDGVRETADCISRERREETLGLLFLTSLSGRDVVIGKLAAGAIRSFTAFLAMFPILAMPLMMGGITVGEYCRVLAALLVALFFSLACGLLLSAICVKSLTSLAGALALVLTITLLPMATIGGWGRTDYSWTGGPMSMFLQGREWWFSVVPQKFWWATYYSLAWCAVLIVMAGFLATRAFRREAQPGTSETWLERWLKPKAGPPRPGRWEGEKPAVWLAQRTMPGKRLLWIAIALGACFMFMLGLNSQRMAVMAMVFTQFGFGFLMKLWAVAVAPQSFSAARRNGALELLLCTPLTSRRLVQGQMEALLRYFSIPAFVSAIGLPGAGLCGTLLLHSFTGFRSEEAFEVIGPLLILGMVWLAIFFLDLHAIGYLSLWNSLREPRTERVMARTAFQVLFLPWATGLIPCVGIIGFIVWPAVWIKTASSRLDKHLREEAARPLGSEAEGGSWWPWRRKPR